MVETDRMITRAEIGDALRGEFRRYFGEPLCELAEDRKIYSDLHTDDPIGRAQALEWVYNTLKRLGVDQSSLMGEHKPSHTEDYTIGEVVDIIANSADRQGILEK